MAETPTVLVDGISSIAAHNGVHRITFYRLGNEPDPKQVIELQVPATSLRGIVEALQRAQRT